MKKKTKKLVLAKETVRGLQDGALSQVAGATACSEPFYSCVRFCLDEPPGPVG